MGEIYRLSNVTHLENDSKDNNTETLDLRCERNIMYPLRAQKSVEGLAVKLEATKKVGSWSVGETKNPRNSSDDAHLSAKHGMR